MFERYRVNFKLITSNWYLYFNRVSNFPISVYLTYHMVLITLKTLQQETFSIEAIPSDTVAALKLKVQAAKSFEPTHQKLIFKGKILADDITVESSGLTEKDFVVCMVTKVSHFNLNLSRIMVKTSLISKIQF